MNVTKYFFQEKNNLDYLLIVLFFLKLLSKYTLKIIFDTTKYFDSIN